LRPDAGDQLSPDQAVSYNDAAVAYGLKGDSDRAINDFDQGRALNAQYAPTFNNRAISHAQGPARPCHRGLRSSRQAERGYAVAFYNRGNAKYRQGDYAARSPTMTAPQRSIRRNAWP